MVGKRNPDRERSRFNHWLQPFAVRYGFGEIPEDMIRKIPCNPNCTAIGPGIDVKPSRFNLTKQQLKFIELNLHSIIEIERLPIDNSNKPTLIHVSRYEVQVINDMIAGIEVKQINRQQIANQDYIFGAMHQEIGSVYCALESYHMVKDAFELNMLLPTDRCVEKWDNVWIGGQLACLIEDLRSHDFSGFRCGDATRCDLPWRDGTPDMKQFREHVFTLIQILWLAVHPFR